MKVNLSPKQVGDAVTGVDKLIGKIPKKTQQTVRSVFMLLIFMATVGGIAMGVMWGKQAAEIKSAPIIERTNDAFELDIKREHPEGTFSVLDSEMINEMKKMDPGKAQFPTRATMEPEVDKGIIEGESGRKVKQSPEIRSQDPLFEGEYRKKPSIESDVKSIEKRSGASLKDRESLIENEKKGMSPLGERGPEDRGDPYMDEPGGNRPEKRASPKLEDSGTQAGPEKGEARPARKRRPASDSDIRGLDSGVRRLQKKRPSRDTDIRSLEPNNREEGIVGE
ncbi:MAG: hypothetical protein KA369_15000 [Spirochaetes bacterium]|nr:hypothetical protein [Spirochaetota bacterium]